MRENEIKREMEARGYATRNDLVNASPAAEPLEIHILPDDGIEAHLMGGYVAVVWNLEKRESRLAGPDGKMYTRVDYERRGNPYIDFISLRQDSVSGQWYRDEDSPVDGGLAAGEATTIIKELQRALLYLKLIQLQNQATPPPP